MTFSDVVTAVVHIDEIEDEDPEVESGDSSDTEGESDLRELRESVRMRVEPDETPSQKEDKEVTAASPDGAARVPAGTGIHRSLDVLINTIPGEVLVLWAAIEGAAELYGFSLELYIVLLVVAILATPVYVYRSIEKPEEESYEFTDADVRWWQESNVRWQTVSATGAFLVWTYYLGGPFQLAGLQRPSVAVALVIMYPVLIVISPYYGSLLMYQSSHLFGHSSA